MTDANLYIQRAMAALGCPNPVHAGEGIFRRLGVKCADCQGRGWRVSNPHEAVEILCTEGILPEAAMDHSRWRWQCTHCSVGDCPRCRHRCGLRNRPASIEALMRAVAFGPEELLRIWQLARTIFPEIEGIGWGIGYGETRMHTDERRALNAAVTRGALALTLERGSSASGDCMRVHAKGYFNEPLRLPGIGELAGEGHTYEECLNDLVQKLVSLPCPKP